MNLERMVRRLAGFLILTGLFLGLLVSPWFFILVGFVGVNLFQSSYTGFCPAEQILKRARR
jgi:Inner membrane protein YgaP-like, transmembrane domain